MQNVDLANNFAYRHSGTVFAAHLSYVPEKNYPSLATVLFFGGVVHFTLAKRQPPPANHVPLILSAPFSSKILRFRKMQFRPRQAKARVRNVSLSIV